MYVELYNIIHKINPTIPLTTRYKVFKDIEQIKKQNPQKLANWIGSLLEILERSIMLTGEAKERRKAICLMLNICEEYYTLVNRNEQRMRQIIEATCQAIAMEVKDQYIKSDWFCCQVEDIQQKKPTSSSVGFFFKIKNHLGEFCKKIPYGRLLDNFQKSVPLKFSIHNWKYRAAFIMFFSELSKNSTYKESYRFPQLINLIKVSMQDEEPQLLTIIFQIILEMQDFFGKKFVQTYLLELLPLMTLKCGFKDSQYYCSLWLKTLAQMFDQCSRQSFIPKGYVQIFVDNLCVFLGSGKDQLREQALKALENILNIENIMNAQNLAKIMEVFSTLLQSNDYNDKLKQKTIQCIALTLSSQPITYVNKYIEPTVTLIFNLIKNISHQSLFICFTYLTSLGDKFVNWKQMYIKLFAILEKQVQCITCYGFDMIKNTATNYQSYFQEFSLSSLQFLTIWLRCNYNKSSEVILSQAIKTIAAIITKASPHIPNQRWIQLKKINIHFFVQNCQIAYSLKKLILFDSLAYASMKCFVCCKQVFAQPALLQIFTYFHGLFFSIKEQRVNYHNKLMELQDQGINGDRLQSIEIFLNQSQKINDRISRILLQITKIVSQPASKITTMIEDYKNLILNACDSTDLFNAGLIIKGLIEHFDFIVLKYEWSNFQDSLMLLLKNEQALVRMKAAQGIGLIIKKTPAELVTLNRMTKWLDALKSSYYSPKKIEEHKQDYYCCKQRSALVYGWITHKYFKTHLLRHQYRQWLQFLPLHYNTSKNKAEIDRLCNILDFDIYFAHSKSKIEVNLMILQKIFHIFGFYVEAQLYSPVPDFKTVQRIKTSLYDIVRIPLYSDNKHLMGVLMSDKQKQCIEDLLQSQSLMIQMSSLNFQEEQ